MKYLGLAILAAILSMSGSLMGQIRVPSSPIPLPRQSAPTPDDQLPVANDDTRTYHIASDNRPLLAPKAQAELEEGEKAMEQGKFQEASTRFKSAYRVAPGNPSVNMCLGVVFLALNRLDQADVYLGRAASLDPQDPATLTAVGILQMRKEDYAGAVASLEPVIKRDRKEYLPHFIISEAYLQEHLFQRAYDEAQLALRWGKGDGKASRFIAGEALAAMGRTSQALTEFREFLKDHAQNPPDSSLVPDAIRNISKLEQLQNNAR
jgi:Flp pilus assembly protein TadD